jgi:hypothetical protein
MPLLPVRVTGAFARFSVARLPSPSETCSRRTSGSQSSCSCLDEDEPQRNGSRGGALVHLTHVDAASGETTAARTPVIGPNEAPPTLVAVLDETLWWLGRGGTTLYRAQA